MARPTVFRSAFMSSRRWFGRPKDQQQQQQRSWPSRITPNRSSIDVTHVGIYVGNGQMVDAPHTGAEVRVESFPAAVGASWRTDTYLGATSIDD
jgi:hypothetical protein